MLPTDDKERAKYRLLDYFYGYFLKAQLAKTKHSYESNIKHCGTEGMEWASEKSVGDGNQIMRHLVDGMTAAANDDIREAEYHLTCLAWRADELLERLLNKMPPFEHLKSVGMYQIDEAYVGSDEPAETDETTEDSEVVCGADGCHIATWVENPRGFDIKDQGFRSYLDRECWFFGVQGKVLLLHDGARNWGEERVRELYSEYLASEKGASGHGEGRSDG